MDPIVSHPIWQMVCLFYPKFPRVDSSNEGLRKIQKYITLWYFTLNLTNYISMFDEKGIICSLYGHVSQINTQSNVPKIDIFWLSIDK